MNERILLVESRGRLRRLFRKELTREGYHVATTSDSAEAIFKLRNEPVDLVVIDLKHLKKSEMEYLQDIMNVGRDVKVVLSSADPNPELDFRSWAADALLVQPRNVTELKDTIHKVLQS